jgi:alpha-D-ribose 1-methylphosphonate 5-triphosphate synthase subunit PhnH
MRLDHVHDLQRSFRALVHATSFPGSIVEIAEPVGKIDVQTSTHPALILFSLMLLDSEVTFALLPGGTGDGELISRMTYSRQSEVATADFILLGATGPPLSHVIVEARAGTLEAPHLGATIVWEVDTIHEKGELQLKGPGIDGARLVGVNPIDPGDGIPDDGWIVARSERNREYPMGVDLYVVDRQSRVAALPRTTQISRVGH